MRDLSWSCEISCDLCWQEVDLAAAPLYITEQRAEVVDFSVPFLVVEAAILLRKSMTGNHDLRVRSAADLLIVPPDVLEFGTLNAGLIYRTLRTSNSTLHRMLYSRMRRSRPSAFVSSNEEGINRVRASTGRRQYAFILPRTIADYISRRYPCDLRLVVDPGLANERFGLAVPRGSGLRPQLNRALRQLIADDFVTRLYARWMLDSSECGGKMAAAVRASGSAPQRMTSSAVAVATVSFAVLTLYSTVCDNVLFLWW